MDGQNNTIQRLKFAWYCLKKSGDSRFIKRVNELGKDNNLVELIKTDNGIIQEPIYFIDMEESHSGFFAEHNRLLGFLYFADQYGLKPVVRLHKGYCYAEDHPVNGTDNPFEYYFEQPAGIMVKDINKYQHVLKSRKENSKLAVLLNEDANGYMRNEKYLQEMGRITEKYIHLNPVLKEYIESEKKKIFGEQTETDILAVHVRGTDFKQNYNGHPVQVTIEEYLQEARTVYNQRNYKLLFLATDDEDAIGVFKKEFGDKLVYYTDVIRSKGKVTVMNSIVERKDHHYKLGVEVLRDMYTLAACGGLVAGLSQVSYAARIQKKSTGHNYRDLSILNKGINYHQKENCPD